MGELVPRFKAGESKNSERKKQRLLALLQGNCFSPRRTGNGKPAIPGLRGESHVRREFVCFPFCNFSRRVNQKIPAPSITRVDSSTFQPLLQRPQCFLSPRTNSEDGRDEGERGDVFRCRCFEIQRGFCFAGRGEDLTLMSSALVVQKCSGHHFRLPLHDWDASGPLHFHPPTDAEPLFLPPELHDWQKSPVV